MSRSKGSVFLIILILVGTSVSLVSVFLPWGYTGGVFMTGTSPRYWLGIGYIEMAVFSFVASVYTLCLAAVFFWKPRWYTAALVLVGSVAILAFSGAWIVSPTMRLVDPHLGLDWPYNVYSVVFGAYICLLGSIVAFGASLSVLLGSRKLRALKS